MLAAWEREFPGRTESIARALRNVEPAALADPRHFDFVGLDLERLAPMSEHDEDRLAEYAARQTALPESA